MLRRALASLVRPPKAFPEDAKHNAKWLQFVSFDAKSAPREQDWLRAVQSAKLIRRDEESRDDKHPDAIVWHKVDLGLRIDYSHSRALDDTDGEQASNWQQRTCIDNDAPCKYMHVLRLPLSVPDDGLTPHGDLLFVRGDTIELFKLVRGMHVGTMIGNAGSGNAVFQWIYLLFMLRPDIYLAMSGEPNLPPSSKHRVDTPNTVIRSEDGGNTSTVFFVEDGQAFQVQDRAWAVANMFDSPSSLLLWSPAATPTGSELYKEIDSGLQIFSTVSPDTSCQHRNKLRKDTVFCWMPCASLAELLVMGRFMRRTSHDSLLSEDNIRRRVSRFGPYIDSALPRSRQEEHSFEVMHNRATYQLRVEDLFTNEDDDDGAAQVSHFFAKMCVDRNSSQRYLAPSKFTDVACESAMRTIFSKLLELYLEELASLYNQYVNGRRPKLDMLLMWAMFVKESGRSAVVVHANSEPPKDLLPEVVYITMSSNTFPFVDCRWRLDKEVRVAQIREAQHPAFALSRTRLNTPARDRADRRAVFTRKEGEEKKAWIQFAFAPEHHASEIAWGETHNELMDQKK